MKKEKIVSSAVFVIFGIMMLVQYFSPSIDAVTFNLLVDLFAYMFIGTTFYCAYLLYKK